MTINSVIFRRISEELAELTEIDSIGQAPYSANPIGVCAEDLAALAEPDFQKRIRQSYELVAVKQPQKIRATLK